MKFFATVREVSTLEALLETQTGLVRQATLVELAWHLRHRHIDRALEVVAQANVNLCNFTTAELRPVENQRMMARLLLVRGDVSLQMGEIDVALRHAEVAMADFNAIDDPIGTGDAGWLQAAVMGARGDLNLRHLYLTQALARFSDANDQVRVDTCRAYDLFLQAFEQPNDSAAALAQFFGPHASYDAGTLTWLNSAKAVVAYRTDNFAGAIRYFSAAQLAAQESGQIAHSVRCASDGAGNCALMGDLDGALEWIDDALKKAKDTQPPLVVGYVQIQLGFILLSLRQFADAKAAIIAGLSLRKDLKTTFAYVNAIHLLGQIALEQDDPAAALVQFEEAEQAALEIDRVPLVRMCRRGQADALFKLGQPQEAISKISTFLDTSELNETSIDQVDALRVLAKIHQKYALPAPPGMTARSVALHYLGLAQQVSKKMRGYAPDYEFLTEIAVANEAVGDYETAYTHSVLASAARDTKRLKDAQNRALSMRIRSETEQARAEAAHHRQLARKELERAELFKESIFTLEKLALMGREITSRLESSAVFATLYAHISQLLDAKVLHIFVLSFDEQSLISAYAMEEGRNVTVKPVAINHPSALVAQCARNKAEIVIDESLQPAQYEATEMAANAQSLLFLPFLVGDRLLGVLSIQSDKPQAYGERERSVVRALAAYGSIALDNASAYAVAENERHNANTAMNALDVANEKLADRAEWLANEVNKATHEIIMRERETVIRLTKAAEFRDPETGAHILRMAHYSALIAAKMGLPQADQDLILEAAPMHDIGKVGIADQILLKPGRLTPQEMEIMKQHAVYGFEILKDSSSKILRAGAEIAKGHHEKFDGTGYPNGLKGLEIPIFSRIVAVADVFDALTSERPYKKAWEMSAAIDYIQTQSGAHFDPGCVAAFVGNLDEVVAIRNRFHDES